MLSSGIAYNADALFLRSAATGGPGGSGENWGDGGFRSEH